MDYIDLLGRTAPDFAYTILTAPLTFYDCSREGTLSTKYHADYCKIWPEHFARLNKACYAAHCPQEDMRPLHRAELTVYAEGVADILRRDPAKRRAVRRDKAYAALRSPWLHALLELQCLLPALPLAQHPPCLGHGRGQADRLSPVRQAGLGRILSAGQEAAQGLMCRTYRKRLAGATQSLPPAAGEHGLPLQALHLMTSSAAFSMGRAFSLRTNRADCAQMSMRFALLSTVNRALLRTERVFCPFCRLVR